jgi:hypothetical protein
MKHSAPVRKEMGIRTIFNILGPLANPAGAKMQLMGVYDEKLVEPLAQVLSNLGVKRGMVVYGCDGLDEVTLTTKTKVCEINKGELKSYDIDPQDFGLNYCALSELIGGNPEENAQITRRILSGSEQGPKRDVVALNAAVCLYLGGKADTLQSAFTLAQQLIDSGAALRKLDEFTFNRIKKDNTLITDDVKECLCVMMEKQYNVENQLENNISSETVGNTTTTYVTAKDANATLSNKLYEVVKSYLWETGLLYRGID